MSKPRQHHNEIIAWANGSTIQRSKADRDWRDADWPTWDEDTKYRVKPEPPAKVHPVTRMSGSDFAKVIGPRIHYLGYFEAELIANAALRHAIDAEQVVTMGTHVQALRQLGNYDRGARDMAIAAAVADAYIRKESGIYFRLAEIIAKVPA